MILGLSGKKHAGKNTVANIIHGLALKQMDMVKDWKLESGSGDLWVDTHDGTGWGTFDATRRDAQFTQWADLNLYPFIKMYSFADALKWLAVELFDIPEECCFGTEDQKNQKHEHLLWENMPGILTHHTAGPMTAREFLQYFGTDMCRRMWEPIWVNKCIKDIKREGTLLAIVTDVRFPNEVDIIEDNGGTTLRLTRQIFEDNHDSETALDDYNFTNYLDNHGTSIEKTIAKVQKFYNTFLSEKLDDSNLH